MNVYLKKCGVIIAIIFFFPVIAFAQTTVPCTDIGVNLYKGLETSSVLKLQNFLYGKGHLKAKPNGYYGPGTMAAVKAYQKSVGITQTGSVATLTRARIKKDSCGVTGSNVSPSTSTVAKPESSPAAQPVVSEPVKVVPLTKNDQRRKDITAILQALADRYRSTQVHSLAVTNAPIELCVKPAFVMASSSEVAVLVTPESPCKDYVDISYLAPSYLATIPRDPTLSTSSVLTGYTITRSESNTITISAKTVDNGAIIKATCNFNAGCRSIDQISTVIYETPYITSIDRPIFLSGSTPKTAITIVGKGFTSKNRVTLTERSSSREYNLGEFPSTDGTSTQITPSALNKKFSCGDGCLDSIPFGEYMVVIKNEGGTSNIAYISIKSFNTSTISSHGDSTVTPKSTGVKVGSITLSSSIPLTLKSLTLVSTTTNKALPAKILKLVAKDPATNASVTAGGLTFSFPSNTSLLMNESKVFDIYADIDDVLLEQSGRMIFGGTMLARDPLLGYDLEIPMKEFSFTVSY
jgi:peptidoglycan hydrolase-like protein with peptidoglycan-binding domain